ncbi:hypothetical protein GCM10022257_07650 [Hyunsoonleella aestuarii]|uniref:Uncharacterized protein n=1 Tax=Hyunsoonleella aestuarii TaxID=912802 RepID=A0ABP8E9K6_9FLAO
MATAAISIEATNTNKIIAINIRVRNERFFNFILIIDALNIAIIKPNTLREVPK